MDDDLGGYFLQNRIKYLSLLEAVLTAPELTIDPDHPTRCGFHPVETDILLRCEWHHNRRA
jgi:hypothetical protein